MSRSNDKLFALREVALVPHVSLVMDLSLCRHGQRTGSRSSALSSMKRCIVINVICKNRHPQGKL